MALSSNPFGFSHFIENLNIISLSIIFILLFMSVLSWYLIITKTLQLWFTVWRSNRIVKVFWNTSSLTEILHFKSKDPFSLLAKQGINAAFYYKKRTKIENICSQSEFLTRNLKRAINEETAQLNSGLTILATVGSTAPFVGLLGTVLGIYDALITISTQGSASLDTVAAPVGEALIMTAFGLAVAIPAVLAYNAILRSNRVYLNKLQGFAHDLHTCLNTGARIDLKKINQKEIEMTFEGKTA